MGKVLVSWLVHVEEEEELDVRDGKHHCRPQPGLEVQGCFSHVGPFPVFSFDALVVRPQPVDHVSQLLPYTRPPRRYLSMAINLSSPFRKRAVMGESGRKNHTSAE